MKIIRPVKDWYLTQEFWENPKYYSQFKIKWHNGLDYWTHRKPWEVLAVFNWIVRIDTHSVYWERIRLYSDDWKYMAMYAHLSEPLVVSWTKVSVWDTIWMTGNTGNSKWIHLHFAIYEVNEKWEKLNRDNWYFGAIDCFENDWKVIVKNKDITVYSRKESFEEVLRKLSFNQIVVLYKGKYFVNHKGKKLLLNEDNIWDVFQIQS